MTAEFVFATARYESGDWDSAPLLPANIIDTIARYTEIQVAPTGLVVALSDARMLRYPLLYLTGHLPVRFSDAERANVRRFVERGGLLFVDDHNHDVDGTFHKTATEEIGRTVGPLVQLPNDHRLYSAFFKFDGPPTTSHELNGWGDNLVHDHLFAVMRGDRDSRRRATPRNGVASAVQRAEPVRDVRLGRSREVGVQRDSRRQTSPPRQPRADVARGRALHRTIARLYEARADEPSQHRERGDAAGQLESPTP